MRNYLAMTLDGQTLSAFALSDRMELIEAYERNDQGEWNWETATICEIGRGADDAFIRAMYAALRRMETGL